MSQNNQYDDGYSYFNTNTELLSPEHLKQKHPLFRRGYRTAQEDLQRKNTSRFPSSISEIPKHSEVFNAEYRDILAATRRPRFQKLHYAHMAPVLDMLIKSVENKKSEIKRYNDVVRLVDQAFDIILQYGYDCGVLDEIDLKQYNYSPK